MAEGRVSCNLVFVTIDQLDLCAITSPFQSTVVIMPLEEREGERESETLTEMAVAPSYTGSKYLNKLLSSNPCHSLKSIRLMSMGAD